MTVQVPKSRLEAFSDGVIAILITIMVLELKPPQGAAIADLKPLLHTFFSYLLSFAYLAIYWNNHHHMLYATRHINGPIMWGNLHLLFWLSLIPFVTAWVGQAHGAAWPTAFYGMVLLLAAIAYYLLQLAILAMHGRDSDMARALEHSKKEKISVGCYAVAIGFAFLWPWVSTLLYILVAVMWIVPDKRLEPLAR